MKSKLTDIKSKYSQGKHPNSRGNDWKGENAGKSAMHKWLDVHFGKPKVCEHCDTPNINGWFDWALKKEKKYSHNRDDYFRLCRSCHRIYDRTFNKGKLTDKQVLEIRARFPETKATILAIEYGVHVRTINGIISRKIWKFI